MSVQAVAYVWRFSPAEHGRLLVHLAIADTVNQENEVDELRRQVREETTTDA